MGRGRRGKALPQGYLSKPGGQWRAVSALDLAVLIYHMLEGAKDPDIGFEDAQEPLEKVLGKLNKAYYIDPAVLESALWSCNLMREKGKFTHPKGLSFEDWVKKFLNPGEKYSLTYNFISKDTDLFKDHNDRVERERKKNA